MQFASTLLSFGILGFVNGAWQISLSELQVILNLSPGAVGVLLTGGTLVALPSMIIAGRLSDRFGPQAIVAGTGVLLAFGLAGVASIRTYLVLLPFFGVFLASSGSFDVGMNSAAITVEQQSGGSIMSYFHAAYSGAAAIGALVAGVMLGAGLSLSMVYLCLAGLTLIFVGGLVTRLSYPAQSTTEEVSDGDASVRSLFFEPIILLVAVIVSLAFFAEGAMENWAAIYLRTVLDAPVSVGSFGVVGFHTAMTVGRINGAWAARAFAPRTLLFASGVIGAVGMAVALLTSVLPLVVIGFALVGLSMAIVAPLGFSIAGDLAPNRSGEASSVVTFVGYGAFLVGPVIIGGVAEITTLGMALALVLVSGSVISALSTQIPDSEEV
ncbi:MFS transporter [Haloferax sp. ATB1]|uniref:MFS transporter n=1 Tax=Haloferax sp. ATB1 TaxID=1508454 RepID=UPI0012FE8C2D|nr:MFS transporter [Haloferax sp. ATB1]